MVEASASNPTLTRNEKGLVAFGKTFSRSASVSESKPISVCLSNLLGHIGIDLVGSMMAVGSRSSTYRPTTAMSITQQQESSKLLPTVLLPSSSHPEDLYTRASQNGRESMVMRMEKIFDEVESRLSNMDDDDDSPFDLENFSSELEDSTSEKRLRHLSKPVVIGDSIPPPLNCPAVVQHVLPPPYLTTYLQLVLGSRPRSS